MEGAGLVLGQRLGRVQVERSRRPIAAQYFERRQLEAQGLPGGGARGDDGWRIEGPEDRLRLMAIEARDAGLCEGVSDAWAQLLRDRDQPGRARGVLVLVDEALVRPADLQ